MPMWIVYREPGPAWDPARERREQRLWDEHAEFMDDLVADGFVVLGGPVGDGHFVLHAVEAESEEEIRRRLADDPWDDPPVLVTAKIEPWTILLDARRR
jgi:uncharacterized protein